MMPMLSLALVLSLVRTGEHWMLIQENGFSYFRLNEATSATSLYVGAGKGWYARS